MRKLAIFIICALAVAACDKHDPILPGVRDSVFNTKTLKVLNESVPNAPENVATAEPTNCPYTQKPDNTVWDGERKVFSGFATGNSVAGTRTPICNGKYVYAGLSTGEFVKINPRSRAFVWIADIYRPSNMTGGASILDIVATPQIHGKYVYVGGLGDALCKISDATGNKVWCVDIGVEKDFVVTDAATYVVDTENNLNAVRNSDGAIYWRRPVKKSRIPKYENKTVIVGSEKFDAESGNATNK